MSLTTAPFMFHCWFEELPMALNEVCWPERLPPTFAPLITMPGVCSIITHGSRALGIFSSMSLVKLADIVVEVVSVALPRISPVLTCARAAPAPAATIRQRITPLLRINRIHPPEAVASAKPACKNKSPNDPTNVRARTEPKGAAVPNQEDRFVG